MNHKVNNVQQLYTDANMLYHHVVLETADSIIDDLKLAVNVLKNSWEGKDAGVQIENVIDVHNAMVGIRNILAELARDSSAIAVKYREIQNANRANLENLVPVSITQKSGLDAYMDNRDTINITPEAINGKNKLGSAAINISEFISGAKRYIDAILENWQVGTGREKAAQSFEEFVANSNSYKETLEQVSESIEAALKNYQF